MSEYKLYYGIMEYYATGEGLTIIYYVDRAKNENQFKEMMISECNINPYYQIGIEIFDEIDVDTPELIKEYFNNLQDGVGNMKFQTYMNFS